MTFNDKESLLKTNLLIEKTKNGDHEAFEELIKSSETIVYNIAYRMLSNHEDVKDVSQEVFIKVYKYIHKFDGKSAFTTWIYKIAVNTCIDELRKKKRNQNISMDEGFLFDEGSLQKQFADDSLSPEEKVIMNDNALTLKTAIDKLPESQKLVINLRDIEGFSYEEVSEIIGIPLGTVKSRIARARDRLKKIVFDETGYGT